MVIAMQAKRAADAEANAKRELERAKQREVAALGAQREIERLKLEEQRRKLEADKARADADRRKREADRVESERRAKAAEEARARLSVEEAKRARELEVRMVGVSISYMACQSLCLVVEMRANRPFRNQAHMPVWRMQAKRKKAEEEARKKDAERAAKVSTQSNTHWWNVGNMHMYHQIVGLCEICRWGVLRAYRRRSVRTCVSRSLPSARNTKTGRSAW